MEPNKLAAAAQKTTGPSIAWFTANGKFLKLQEGQPKQAFAWREEPLAKGSRKRLIFNDYRDLFLLRTGKVGGLVIFHSRDIVKWTNEPYYGAAKAFSRWTYAASESVAGALDIRLKLSKKYGRTMFEIGNVIYNLPDAGNFLWGFSLARMGIGRTMTKVSSESFATVFAIDSNQGRAFSGFRHGVAISWRGDDSADQRAIRHGFNFLETPNVTDESIWGDSDYDVLESKGYPPVWE